MLKQTVIQHTALAKSGGATRIASLLYEGLKKSRYQTIHSFEASENPGDRLISPEKAARAVPENSIVHLHSSADPAAFLSSLPKQTKVIITLHDTQMITGGCSYPLSCTHFDKKCFDPCPRKFPDSETVRKKNISALLDSEAVIISPSSWLARLTRKADKHISVKIIPNGIPWPENMADKKKARKKLGLHPSSKVVLFIAHGGQSAGYKSGPDWKNYWNMIKTKVPEAVGFAIGGDKNSREGDFLSIPYVDRRMLRQFMLAADVFAYPTLADNHPLVILEAMSCGLAPVSYAVGGVVEQIASGVNGILVPPYEKEIFADKVSNLLNNQRQAREMGSQGFHGGGKKYKNIRMTNNYIKIYDNLAYF
ncbi:glycosyltransferase [Maridesulfovibrio hydrothermalis]|uniref:Glycosyl transferase group 1 n=1 Tax=Maridesulfovibrio hydrothermalis AM13 = DSM 14728 TaxID=1121451 RepID=L0RA84_9BACT|nr:glycosyltransferase [Maridesulfovibrio hydrothermalis]CCO23127.1 Glycosyl transferase group 1 [Maridesulfovibrio hydrothermalis AM13 = DSM 14728]